MEGDVEDDGEDEGLADRGQGAGGEGAGEVALHEQDQDVPDNRVDVEKDVLDHDVDVAASLLDQELVVDPGEDAGDGLADDEGDAKSEDTEGGEGIGGEGGIIECSWAGHGLDGWR